MSGNYFAQAEPSQGIFVRRILAKIIRSCFNTTFGITLNFDNLDGPGWSRMVQHGPGWIWIDLVGFNSFASVLVSLWKILDIF